MSKRTSKPTMDISPWPIGDGFQGSEAWWEYTLSQDETDRLNALILAALLDGEVSERLLSHDKSLFEKFGFCDQTITRLCQIEAETLETFTQLMTAEN